MANDGPWRWPMDSLQVLSRLPHGQVAKSAAKHDQRILGIDRTWAASKFRRKLRMLVNDFT